MDLLKVAKLINLKINELEDLKNQLDVLATRKAETSANYEKKLAQRMLALKSNDTQVSIIEKLAKGESWEDKLEMDLSESRYKNALKIIDLTQAQLNGYQSINRYLGEIDA